MRFALTAALLSLSSAVWADATIGAPAPDFSLTDARGKKVALADYKGKTVVLEWFNPRCPFVMRHTKEKTMLTTSKKYGDVIWLGINSTSKAHADFMSGEQIQAWAKENALEYPLLADSDGAVGKAYGAKTTPHLFVIDKAGKVVYAGAIDDDPSGRNAKGERKNYVDQALSGKASEASTKPYGCGVKYSS